MAAAAAVPLLGAVVYLWVREPPTPAPRIDPVRVPPGALGRRVRAAEAEQQAIDAALDALPIEPPGLRQQVAALTGEVASAAGRAWSVDEYLATVDRPALEARLAGWRAQGARSERRGAIEALAEQLEVIDDLQQHRSRSSRTGWSMPRPRSASCGRGWCRRRRAGTRRCA